jgi:hypothetical protein
MALALGAALGSLGSWRITSFDAALGLQRFDRVFVERELLFGLHFYFLRFIKARLHRAHFVPKTISYSYQGLGNA